MKKLLFTAVVVIMALASCAKTEVVKVDESRSIGFDSFVGKPTKDVSVVTTLSNDFYVFGNYGDGNTWTGQAFNNEISSTAYYWQADQIYRFGAYADGSNGRIAAAAFDAASQKLTFQSYTADDTKDLVAAVTENIVANDYYTQGSSSATPVPLTFSHMLSQVKLTFTTDAAATYKMTITDVKINGAVITADGTFTKTGGAEWTGGTNDGEYSYTLDPNVIASGISSSQVKFVIPQDGTDQLTVTFKATLSGEEATGEAEFSASLGHTLSSLASNTWEPGYCYNYNALVKLENVIANPEDKVQITFTPSVETWKETENVDIAPQPLP